MANEVHFILISTALILGIIGIVLVCKAFMDKPSQKDMRKELKFVFIGIWGIVFLFISSIIVIYIYSLQDGSERNIKQKYKQTLPELSHNNLGEYTVKKK